MKTSATSVVGALLLVGTVGGCGGSANLDTRTFELQHLDAERAATIINPYVFGDRPDAPGMISHSDNLLTVRETADNLDKIARVLADYDTPKPSVQLHFQIIEADGSTSADPAIADVEVALRKLFRFEGYRLLAEAVAGGVEGTRLRQQAWADERGFYIIADIQNVRPVGDSGTVELLVGLAADRVGDILDTGVNAPVGKTIVLGNARPSPAYGTVILTVRAELGSN